MLLVQVTPHAADGAPRVQLWAAQYGVRVPSYAWIVRNGARHHRGRTLVRPVIVIATVVAMLGHHNGPIRDPKRLVAGGW
jgi:hypothetical protein